MTDFEKVYNFENLSAKGAPRQKVERSGGKV